MVRVARRHVLYQYRRRRSKLAAAAAHTPEMVDYHGWGDILNQVCANDTYIKHVIAGIKNLE